MREYIRPCDVKKEFRNDYCVHILYSYHNVLAHLERQYDRYGDYSEETQKEITYLEELMLDWAMRIEDGSWNPQHAELKGKLIKECIHDHVYVDEKLEAILKPRRSGGEYIGVSDKKGVSIRVNDVVKTKYGRVMRVVHIVDDGRNGYDLENYDKLDCWTPTRNDMWKSENLEVVNDQYPYEKLEDNRDDNDEVKTPEVRMSVGDKHNMEQKFGDVE